MSVEHFEVLSIELPYVSGVCTVPPGVTWSQGYHTPLTCVESADDTWTYYFGSKSVPISLNEFEPGHPIYRQIKSINENTPTLQLSGMASRGSLSVTLIDWKGDPGPVNTTDSGTYLSKLDARNILSGREVKLYRYTREDGINTLVSTSTYLSDSFSVSQSGDYTLTCKSRLERTYKDYTQFPLATGAKLRLDIDETTTAIPVQDGDYDWSTLPVIRIGDDLMTSTAYDQGTETLTVESRTYGVKTSGGQSISRTIPESHDAGDDIQVCYVSDGEQIADFLETILLSAGVPASYIDKTEWQTEFDDYWAGTTLTNVWSEPTAVREIIDNLCEDYMLDIWESSEDPAGIKVSAVSVWKRDSKAIEVGRGITEKGFTYKTKPELRASRSYVRYDKPFKTENDDIGNYKKAAINSDVTYETEDFYGSVKSVELKPSPLLDTNDAVLRVQRNTSRFSIAPREYGWDCEEKYLDYRTGDIVSFTHQDLQDAEGNSEVVTAQIMQIKPQYGYGGVGRAYKVKATTYLRAIAIGGENTTYRKDATLSEINIHNDFAGRPSGVVDWIVVLDNCKVISDDTINPSMRNGSFAPGSTVTIICINGTDWQSRSGYGGNGAVWRRDFEPGNPPWDLLPPAQSGGPGGTCFNADGIETQIFLEGATGNPTYPTADGYLRAPGGGGGGSGGDFEGDVSDGGGSGAGNVPAVGGAAGKVINGGTITYGNPGGDGDTLGNGGTSIEGGDGGGWGENGQNGTGIGPGSGGLAGKGLIKAGATVTIQYTDPNRFINGSGDTPD